MKCKDYNDYSVLCLSCDYPSKISCCKELNSIEKMEQQLKNIKDLLKLIEDNPDLEIMPMVNSDIVSDDYYSYYCGKWEKGRLDEYLVNDGRIYFKENDFEDLIQEFIDSYEDCTNLSIEELEKIAEEQVNNYGWKKVILVYIETP